MYLSRLFLNPLSRRVQKEIGAPYELHRTIQAAFPAKIEMTERILWRVDVHPQTGLPTLLVQSKGPPDWAYLVALTAPEYLLQTSPPNPAMKNYNPQIASGSHLAFRLRANPTVKRNGKRVGLYREGEQIAWINRKSEAYGFQVLECRISIHENVKGTIHRDAETHTINLLGVLYDGTLQVIDAALFREAIVSGVGSGKGFGFGLLSIAAAM
jgi:CRISPR system Cascade subunit CasE